MGGATKTPRTLPAGIRVLGPCGEGRVLDLWVAAPPGRVAEPSDWPVRSATPSRAARFLAWLLGAFAALQVLDLASTLLLLSIGGTEVNPVSAWLLSHGVTTFVAAKLGLAAILAACIPLVRRARPAPGMRTATWTCAGFDGLYAVAVVSNLAQFAIFA